MFTASIRLLRLAAVFLAGQGAVQALTLATGLMLIRILPVDQFALYTLAVSVLAVVTMGTNMGLTQAIISFGAPRSVDPGFLGALLTAAHRISRWLMAPTVIVAVVAAYTIFSDKSWATTAVIACTLIAVCCGLAQVGSALGRGIFSIHHDARSVFRVGIADAGVRFLALPLTILWPTALTPLLAGLAGAILSTSVTKLLVARYCDFGAETTPSHVKQLSGFITPIAPIAIYSVFQAQIGLLLLSISADARAIAETGALSRIGQIFAILMLINPFLFQPVFARSATREDFLVKLVILGLGLSAFSAATLASANIFPQFWLLLIGNQYSNLILELPFALASALATLIGGTLYTLVIARGSTEWQWLALAPCAATQLMYFSAFGVYNVTDALMMTLLPAAAYALVQLALLLRIISRLPASQRRSSVE